VIVDNKGHQCLSNFAYGSVGSLTYGGFTKCFLNHVEKEHDKLLNSKAKELFYKWCGERIGVTDIIDSNQNCDED
jgi:hypothetical protein